MASEELKLRYARMYLARTYPAAKLAELKALADQTMAAATATVQITTGSFEGGSGGGQIVFEKVILAIAIEERLAQIDPDYVAPAPLPSGSLLMFEPDLG